MFEASTIKEIRRKFRLPWKKPLSAVSLRIPIEFGDSNDFTDRAAKLLADPGTHIYIDTSFLMWLTKIGNDSRAEFFAWIAHTCPKRVCVPIWAAHEYLRHHISGTIVDELGERISELTGLSKKTYSYLRPFMDEPLRGNFTDRGAQQAAARSALNGLSQLADDAKQWKERYTSHSYQVLNFINENTPANSAIFDMLEGIEQIGKSRFDGRIPPGFQDRGKKLTSVNSDDGADQVSITTGSNKYGDLMFWKEVLGLAVRDKARNIILLSNDVKNDWQFGGRLAPNEKELLSIRQKINPIPLAHPMLSLEASLIARAEEVLLIDSVYLGIYLKRHADKSTASFIDVAIVPDSPVTATVADHNKQLSKAYKSQERERDVGGESNYLFADNTKLVNTRFVLVKAWRASAKMKDAAVTSLLERIGQAALDQKSAADVINEVSIGKFTNDQLVSLGRLLHDQSLVEALGGPEIIVDLVSLLDRLPIATAASLHLGLVGSMYFNPGENTPRLPPRSTAAQQIYASQGKKYAEGSIDALTHAFSKLTVRPLYLLQKEAPKIVVELRHLPDADGEFILDSIQVNGMEVYSGFQKLSSHNFRALFHPKKVLTVNEILDATARVYVLPRNQLENDSNPLTEYEIPEFGGFNSSDSIFNN